MKQIVSLQISHGDWHKMIPFNVRISLTFTSDSVFHYHGPLQVSCAGCQTGCLSLVRVIPMDMSLVTKSGFNSVATILRAPLPHTPPIPKIILEPPYTLTSILNDMISARDLPPAVRIRACFILCTRSVQEEGHVIT